MTERPILFNALMVRAILDGSKTQTRRPVKGERASRGLECGWQLRPFGFLNDRQFAKAASRFGQPGDRLWVREAFNDDRDEIIYRADGGMPADWFDAGSKWRPSIHMPRVASRITLEVVAVRVERLQAIREADAVAEGCKANPFPGPWWQGYRRMDDGSLVHQQAVGASPPDWMVEPHSMSDTSHLDRSGIDGYRSLWDQINGAGAWDANPWVWVVEFRRLP